MVILLLSIVLFNFLAFKINKIPTLNRKVHIWLFTLTFQAVFDVFIEFKYQGYWYFDKGVEWLGVLAHIFIIPPVNIILLSWYPSGFSIIKKLFYIFAWTVGIMIYEKVVLLPEPWGYFHLGWWKVWYDLFISPILIIILVSFNKWIGTLEEKVVEIHNK